MQADGCVIADRALLAKRVVATRFGTGGDDPLPAIIEELCYRTNVCQERARVELDATGWSVDQTIKIERREAA